MATTAIWKVGRRLDKVIKYTTNIEKTKNKNYEENSLIVMLDAIQNDMYTLVLIDETHNKMIKLHINIMSFCCK